MRGYSLFFLFFPFEMRCFRVNCVGSSCVKVCACLARAPVNFEQLHQSRYVCTHTPKTDTPHLRNERFAHLDHRLDHLCIFNTKNLFAASIVILRCDTNTLHLKHTAVTGNACSSCACFDPQVHSPQRLQSCRRRTPAKGANMGRSTWTGSIHPFQIDP